jgi:NTE family protein
VIVGTSAGSVTAAGLRGGLPPRDLAARALADPLSADGAAVIARAGLTPRPAALPSGGRALVGRPADPGVLARALRRPWRARPGAVIAGLLPAGSVPTDDIVAATDALHPGGWPAATWVCAAELGHGSLTVFGRPDAPSASIGQAVAASCAIPGFFAPVDIGGVRYVDGGVVSPTNAAVVTRERFDLVLISAPMAIGRPALTLEIAALRRTGTVVHAFTPTAEDRRAMGVNAMDASRRAGTTRAVLASTTRALARPAAWLDVLQS